MKEQCMQWRNIYEASVTASCVSSLSNSRLQVLKERDKAKNEKRVVQSRLENDKANHSPFEGFVSRSVDLSPTPENYQSFLK
jgi:hypothetical protein